MVLFRWVCPMCDSRGISGTSDIPKIGKRYYVKCYKSVNMSSICGWKGSFIWTKKLQKQLEVYENGVSKCPFI